MTTPNNAAALERLENELRESAVGHDYEANNATFNETLLNCADKLATLRATLAQPDALTNAEQGQRGGEAIDRCQCGAPCRKEVLTRGGDNGWGDDASRTILRYVPPTHPSADAQGVAVDEAMVGRFKMACRALMGLRGQRSTVYAEDLETMVDVLRVLESVATLPVVNEAMVGRAYSAWANAKIPDPDDTRTRLWFALTAALAPKPEGGHG